MIRQFLKLSSLILLLLGLIMSPVAMAETSVQSLTLNPLVYGINLNGIDQNVVWVLGENNAHQLYASLTDLDDLNVDFKKYQGTTVSFQDQVYYALDNFPGLTYKIDSQSMAVFIVAPGEVFKSNNVVLQPESFTPTITNGAYLNYNLNSTTTFNSQPGINNLYLSANAFGSYGLGYYDSLIQNTNGQSSAIRLLTAWQKTNPEKMTTLTVGDAFSSVTQWSQSAGFGGVQYSSNFDAQPNFVTSPLPNSSGVATLPSTVQVFVNNTLTNTQSINPGPFQLNDIPVFNGDGTVSIVTTNILGQQTIENIPYSSSNQLLKPGLSSFSYEAGFLRENFSVQSNDYGSLMLSGTYNRGITNTLSLQSHLEGTTSIQAGGVGANLLISKFGIINASFASSLDAAQQAGALGLIGYASNARGYSYGTNLQVTTENFTDVGYSSGGGAPSLQSQTFLAFPLPKDKGTISCSYTLQQNRQSANQNLAALNYSRPFAKTWFFTLSASRSLNGPANSLYMFSLNKLFDDVTTSTSASFNNEGSQENFSAGTQLTDAPGFAYNAQVSNNAINGSGSTQAYQGTVYAQNSMGTYSLGAAHNDSQNVYQLQGAGAIVYADHSFVLSRPINGSFALVETGFPDVQVISNHRPYGTTNRAGNLVVANLNSYLRNTIEIDPEDLPFTATVQDTEVDITPFQGAGEIARFKIGTLSGGLMTLNLNSGEPVPEGAVVTDKDQNIYSVGADGMLYVSGLVLGDNHLSVEYGSKACDFNIFFAKEMLPGPTDPVPQLGAFVCVPVASPAAALDESPAPSLDDSVGQPDLIKESSGADQPNA